MRSQAHPGRKNRNHEAKAARTNWSQVTLSGVWSWNCSGMGAMKSGNMAFPWKMDHVLIYTWQRYIMLGLDRWTRNRVTKINYRDHDSIFDIPSLVIRLYLSKSGLRKGSNHQDEFCNVWIDARCPPLRGTGHDQVGVSAIPVGHL